MGSLRIQVIKTCSFFKIQNHFKENALVRSSSSTKMSNLPEISVCKRSLHGSRQNSIPHEMYKMHCLPKKIDASFGTRLVKKTPYTRRSSRQTGISPSTKLCPKRLT